MKTGLPRRIDNDDLQNQPYDLSPYEYTDYYSNKSDKKSQNPSNTRHKPPSNKNVNNLPKTHSNTNLNSIDSSSNKKVPYNPYNPASIISNRPKNNQFSNKVQTLEQYRSQYDKKIKQMSQQNLQPQNENLTSPNQENNYISINKLNVNEPTEIQSPKSSTKNSKKKFEYKDQEQAQANEKIEVSFRKINNSSTNLTLDKKESVSAPVLLNNDQYREQYTKLYISFKDLTREKEQILASLRKETINNEEQRNYIVILRNTLESNILKAGIAPLLNAQKIHYSKETTNIDILVDAAMIKVEADKFRKELLLSQILNNELKQEFELIKKNYEDALIRNEKLKEEIENLLNEIEHKEIYIKNQEEEKHSLNIDIESLGKKNENLLQEIDKVNMKNKKLEKDLLEMNKKNIDANSQIETLNVIIGKLNEVKKNYETLKGQHENLTQERNALQFEKSQQREELIKKENEIEKLNEKLNHNNEKFEEEKTRLNKEKDTLYKSTKKLEKDLTDSNNKILTKEKEAKDLETKISNLEKNISQNKKLYDDTLKEFEKVKAGLEANIHLKSDRIKEFESQNEELLQNLKKINKLIENQEKDKEILEDILKQRESYITKVEEDLRKQKAEIHQLNKHITELESKIKKLNNTIQEKNNNLKEWEQINQVQNNKLDDFSYQVNELNKEIDKIRQQKINLLDEKEVMSRELNQKIQDYQKKIHDGKNVFQSLHSNTKHFTNKFSNLIKDYPEFFSQGFIDNLPFFESYKFDPQEFDISESLKIHDELINLVLYEFENQFEKNKSLDKWNKDSFDQLQIKIRELQETIEGKIALEEDHRRLKLKYEDLNDERNKLKNEIEQLHKKNERAFNDNFQLRNDIGKLEDENGKITKEAEALQDLNNNLILDLKEKVAEIDNLTFQVQAFEDRIVILIKERKNLKELVKTIADVTHIYEIISISNDLLNLNDEFFELEREKLKIEQTISMRHSESIENLSDTKILNIEQKISENINNQKKLECELRKLDVKNKLLKDENMQKDFLITRLTKDVVDYQEQIKKLKSEFSTNNLEDNAVNLSLNKYEEKKFINYNQDSLLKKNEQNKKSLRNPHQENSESLKMEYIDLFEQKGNKSQIQEKEFERRSKLN